MWRQISLGFYQQISEKKDNWLKKFVLPKLVWVYYTKEKEQILKWWTETDAGNISKIS